MVVALHKSRRGAFLSASLPDDAPVARGIEATGSLDTARRFADQAAVDAFVTAHGGTAGDWIAWALP